MRFTRQILLAISFLSIVIQTQAAPKAKAAVKGPPVSEARVLQCFKDYSFFNDAVINLLDVDRADPKKSKARKILIKNEYEKSPSEVRACLDDIIQSGKNELEPEDLKDLVSHLKEITTIVYSAEKTQSKSAPAVR
jgi:hypothetical protein